jgi:hypothetical protein
MAKSTLSGLQCLRLTDKNNSSPTYNLTFWAAYKARSEMLRANLSKHLYGLFIFICVICLFPVFSLVENLSGVMNADRTVMIFTYTWPERSSPGD